MKRLVLVIALAIAAFIAGTPNAFAHDHGHRVVVVRDGYVRGIPSPAWPHWLRTHHEFQRWYLASHYRHSRHPGWHRLYQLYRQDARFHPHQRGFAHHRHRHGCRHH